MLKQSLIAVAHLFFSFLNWECQIRFCSKFGLSALWASGLLARTEYHGWGWRRLGSSVLSCIGLGQLEGEFVKQQTLCVCAACAMPRALTLPLSYKLRWVTNMVECGLGISMAGGKMEMSVWECQKFFCFSTFRALGLDYKYPSYAAYYKEIRDNFEGRGKFLQAVKEFIAQRNANPSSRIDKEAVKKAETTLHSESRQGVFLKGPKKEFVMLDHWDLKLDGELDESKAMEEMWQGKKVKGIWGQRSCWCAWG